mgnify:CR=1 FL=1
MKFGDLSQQRGGMLFSLFPTALFQTGIREQCQSEAELPIVGIASFGGDHVSSMTAQTHLRRPPEMGTHLWVDGCEGSRNPLLFLSEFIDLAVVIFVFPVIVGGHSFIRVPGKNTDPNERCQSAGRLQSQSRHLGEAPWSASFGRGRDCAGYGCNLSVAGVWFARTHKLTHGYLHRPLRGLTSGNNSTGTRRRGDAKLLDAPVQESGNSEFRSPTTRDPARVTRSSPVEVSATRVI